MKAILHNARTAIAGMQATIAQGERGHSAWLHSCMYLDTIDDMMDLGMTEEEAKQTFTNNGITAPSRASPK